MSLLDNLRRGTESTAMKVFFVIVVITFVFWGVDRKIGKAPALQHAGPDR
jgi:hypothetical protein